MSRSRALPGAFASHRVLWIVVAVASITALALALRLYRLDARSLWLDEILTSQPAHLASPAAVITWSKASINQMPLFYMFTWFLGHWGDGELLLRLPAVLAGTLLVPAVYLLARDLYGARAGLVAALLTAILPFNIWYAQEARNYSLLMLVTTLQMLFALRAVTRGRPPDWIGLSLFSVLNLYTHYVAIAATAAAFLFAALFVLARALRDQPARTRATVAAVLAVAAVVMLAAAGPAIRLLGGSNLGLIASARAHPARALLVVFGGGVVVLGGLGALWSLSPRLRRAALEPRWRQLELALMSAALVALAYLPWLPALGRFLGRPDQSLGQIHLATAPGLSDLLTTLGNLYLTGVVLAVLAVGLAGAIARVATRRSAEAALVLAWVFVPLAIIGRSAGPLIVAIDSRYLAFLVPAALILVAAGVGLIADGAARLLATERPAASLRPAIAPAAAVLVVALLLLQTLPALATSYGYHKNDWRGAAQRIEASNPPASLVVSVANFADWTPICLDYYFRQLGVPVTVKDGRDLGLDVTSRLAGAQGPVWGVVIFPSPEQLALMASSPSERIDWIDVTNSIYLVRAADGTLSPLAQAVTLLRWELPMQPALATSLANLNTGSTS